MKLKDIQEAFDTNISHIDYGGRFDPPDHTFKNWTPDEMGRGKFSKVTRDKDDPHLVDKEQKTKKTEFSIDLFNDYAEIIAKERLWELIHFPRVYAIKTYHDKRGEERGKWKIEKLISMDKVSVEELTRLASRYFIPKIVKEIAEEDYHPSEISYYFDVTIASENWHWVKDQTLQNALKKLKEIYNNLSKKYDKSDVQLDLHDANIMLRRTQHGLEAVFSDPFVRDRGLYEKWCRGLESNQQLPIKGIAVKI